MILFDKPLELAEGGKNSKSDIFRVSGLQTCQSIVKSNILTKRHKSRIISLFIYLFFKLF